MSQQVKTITSESLEAAYRNLTPSQEGFTEDLMASNTIIPVLDLTANAQGTTTPTYLQTAVAFGSQTAFAINNTTSVIASTPGFYRIFGMSNVLFGTAAHFNDFSLSDGLSTKYIWQHVSYTGTQTGTTNIQYDFTVFLAAGESISGRSLDTNSTLIGSSRQVADVNGNLVNPSGFTPQ